MKGVLRHNTDLEIFTTPWNLSQLGLEVREPLAHLVQLVVELEVSAVGLVELTLVSLSLFRVDDRRVYPENENINRERHLCLIDCSIVETKYFKL